MILDVPKDGAAQLESASREVLAPLAIWSLWDMLRFYAVSFGVVMGNIARMSALIASGMSDDEQARDSVERLLAESEPHLFELPLSRVIQNQFSRLQKLTKTADGRELAILLRELHENIFSELTAAYFLMIKADRRGFYDPAASPAFGRAVQDKFPEAAIDIAAASRCFALDEWTACVFHLMRVLEHGLQSLVIEVGLPPLSHENWKNVIDQIEAKIKAMEQLPKTPQKIERLKFLSASAAQFRYFKDAWRNHVAHVHENYDEHSGSPVWTHVKAFMQALSDDVGAKHSP